MIFEYVSRIRKSVEETGLGAMVESSDGASMVFVGAGPKELIATSVVILSTLVDERVVSSEEYPEFFSTAQRDGYIEFETKIPIEVDDEAHLNITVRDMVYFKCPTGQRVLVVDDESTIVLGERPYLLSVGSINTN